jgi:hypothetical protein
MAAFEQLIEQAKKTAGRFGGLLSLLLAVKRGSKITVNFDRNQAAFIVDGDKVNEALVQKELGRIELKIAALIRDYNEKLFKKQWTLAKWREEMDKLVETSHLLFAALALGGLGAAAASVDVKRRIKRDKTAVVRFARALRYKQIPSLPLAQNRGRAYLRSFYVTYQLLDQKTHIDAGFTEAKNILSAAEHCRTSIQGQAIHRQGCYETALRGWLLIKDMPPIGTRVCGQFCKCHLIYR